MGSATGSAVSTGHVEVMLAALPDPRVRRTAVLGKGPVKVTRRHLASTASGSPLHVPKRSIRDAQG